ncbi:MAG TPA: MFS transporter [Vicinamibacterales bacterium]|nr:MFS transporter [Vicinamibacterales bacterium]
MSSRVALMLRAFSYPNYRLFFGGQIVSLVGSWMSMTATSWLVYRLTGSPMVLGVVGFAGQFPGFVMGPFAGAYLDRWDRHRVLVVTQAVSMMHSFVLALLMFSGHISVSAIIVLNAVQGIVNAFDMPARQAFLVTMITDKDDLANAIAMNSSMFNSARLVGPSIAGLIIATAGEAWCFLIDGVSYFAVIIALLSMKNLRQPSPALRQAGMIEQLLEGWRYVFGFRPIRSLMLLLAWLCLVAMPFSVLMPVFADEILGGGAYTLGFLMTASGVGALSGALWLTTRKSVVGLGRVILINTAVFGVGLIGFALSRRLWLSLIFLVVVGVGMMVQMAATNTVIQTIVDDEKRGRVMSFYTMAFLGTAPFGSLLAGAISTRLGAPHTMLMSGALCLAAAVWFARELPEIRALVRPIYMRMGILPEVASGLQSAANLMTPPEE